MTYHQIVMKLIGKVEPVGETETDSVRLGNLEELCGLMDKLLYDIILVAGQKDCPEYSRKKAGEFAYKYLQEIKNSI